MVTPTGDLHGNLEKLKSELHKIKMPISKFEEQKVRQGDPAAFLPILHYSLISFSKPLAREIVENNYELNGKTDLRFLESVWKLLRELVNYKPALSVNQFLSQGFAERKILTVCDIVALCRQRHSELLRQAGKHAGKRRPIGHSAGIPSAHIWDGDPLGTQRAFRRPTYGDPL
uniref:Centrosomal protein of 44 kDa n=1 Tax=Tetraselmis sp. GSL018 TaxID=582737 RepID=A0A061RRN5_9CHLO